MNDYRLYIIIAVVTIFTVVFRTLPIFIKIPEHNKKINRFFDFMPISILTVLAFPDIFTSVGTRYIDICIAIFSTLIVIYLSYKKKSMGITLFISFIIIVILKELLNGKF